MIYNILHQRGSNHQSWFWLYSTTNSYFQWCWRGRGSRQGWYCNRGCYPRRQFFYQYNWFQLRHRTSCIHFHISCRTLHGKCNRSCDCWNRWNHFRNQIYKCWFWLYYCTNYYNRRSSLCWNCNWKLLHQRSNQRRIFTLYGSRQVLGYRYQGSQDLQYCRSIQNW